MSQCPQKSLEQFRGLFVLRMLEIKQLLFSIFFKPQEKQHFRVLKFHNTQLQTPLLLSYRENYKNVGHYTITVHTHCVSSCCCALITKVK